MFLTLHTTYFAGYADDNTSLVIRDNIKDLISAFEEIGEKLLTWVSKNEMKLKADKCHLLLNTQENYVLKMGNFNIKNSFSEKLLSVNFDYDLKFNIHIEDISKKASHKLNAFTMLTPCVGLSKCQF